MKQEIKNPISTQRGEYESTRKWTDQFLPEIKIALRTVAEGEATVNPKESTDFLALDVGNKRVAARVRHYGNEGKYIRRFALRAWSQNGTRTELEKIRDGWGQWLFYGFGIIWLGDTTPLIPFWHIFNLDVFRQYHRRAHFEERKNFKGDLSVYSYYIDSFPDDLIVATKEPDIHEVLNREKRHTREYWDYDVEKLIAAWEAVGVNISLSRVEKHVSMLRSLDTPKKEEESLSTRRVIVLRRSGGLYERTS